jgi:hypothetical protein
MTINKTTELLEFEFIFKSKFYVNKNNYPSNWKAKQIIDAELDSFYDDQKSYIELLIDEDEYEVIIHKVDK